ncbi:MAG: PDZ domain-containing protein, partial [Planctomycetes bacterium]|nr:PDZ domain-containing protein [Planctomycetota bacterium]
MVRQPIRGIVFRLVLGGLLALVGLLALGELSASRSEAQEQRQRRRRGRDRGEGRDEDPRTLPDAWMKQLEWRSIGPANMSGRIVAIAVDPKDSSHWWAASASGGLLETQNNGLTFAHRFDQQSTVSIGHVAIAPSDSKIIWVGTGEANPRNSVSWGDGVYKSIDGGRTWKNMGLRDSFQIGRIAIHPTDPDTVYVGALGRLWGPSDERGLYKTTDGGETWTRVLFVDEHTGIIDIDLDPSNPETLIVASYERQRNDQDQNAPEVKIAPGSKLWRSTDGGTTWTRLENGLPSCDLGRIGVDFCAKQPEIVYAVIESEKIGQAPPSFPFAGMTGENADVGARITTLVDDGPAAKAGVKVGDIAISIDGAIVYSMADLESAIRRRSAGETLKLVVSRNRESVALELKLESFPEPNERGDTEDEPRARRPRGENRNPFSQFLGGQTENLQEQQGDAGHEHGGVYRSDDGGVTWKRVNSVNPRPMYFSQIRIDPNNPDVLFMGGVGLHMSIDGGRSFVTDAAHLFHGDGDALYLDPFPSRHVLIGGDGGVAVTWDQSKTWTQHNNLPLGLYYHVSYDMETPYNVCGGLQD